MIKIINKSHDPYYNLALEEFVVTEMSDNDDYFFLWQNEQTVVVGKNQNTIEEINYDFIKQRGINVVRRMSGGGAVYHDYGNLNFTFVVQENGQFHEFNVFTSNVVNTLEKLGIKAENSGRNDITINGRKFSGNAQYRHGKRLLHHGTILFNSDLDVIVEALNVKPEKIVSKGIKSVKSRVTNIKEHLNTSLKIEEFEELLSETILSAASENRTYYLTEAEKAAVTKLRNDKYSNWAWIYGNSPPFNVQKKENFSWGNIDIQMNVNKGYINECKIFGDFFAGQDIEGLEKILIGLAYQEEIISECLSANIIKAYFPWAQNDEIIKLLF